MATYIIRRLLQIVPLVLLVSVVCFALMHAVPGGPAGMLANNPKLSADDVERIRANFGLDEPVPVQYFRWLERVVLHGDFGRSYVTGESVGEMIMSRLPATLELMVSAFVMALLGALAIALLGALRPHSKTDQFATLVSLVLLSIPVFWSGLMALMVFSVRLGLLPSGGAATLGTSFSMLDHLRHLALPSLVLAAVFVASWSRYLRVSLTEAMSENYIQVARAKGVPTRGVVMRHAMRNALGPILTVIALNLPLLFTGSIIVETLFSWPGMGRLFYEGLARMDYTRLMGIVFVSSFLIAFFNTVVDVVYGFTDPRLRYSR